jgi:hypothetical protein
VRRLGPLAVALLASTALGDASWLTARGRLMPETRLEVFGGVREAGVGVVLPDGPEARAALAAEVLYSHVDRTAELRGARVWQFTEGRFATASASLGVSALLVPEGVPTVGAGPHAGLTLSLGGRTFSVELGLQAGLEVFGTQPAVRVPLRALLGLDFAFGPVSLALMARMGVDLEPGRPFLVGRGDAILALGWLKGG